MLVTAPLTAPRCCPAKLADTARARDYRSSLRIRHQRCLQCQVLFIRHVAENELRKEARLDEAEHQSTIRQCRIRSSGEVSTTHWIIYVRLLAARFGEPGYGPIGDLQCGSATETSRIDTLLRSPTLPHIPRKFTRQSHLASAFVPKRLFSSAGRAARVGSIPIARSTFRCLASPCVAVGRALAYRPVPTASIWAQPFI